jgi:hypothetical protein
VYGSGRLRDRPALIHLSPGFYGDRFDGRIEYYRDLDEFCIFYEHPASGRTEARVRFTIAHELAHFYLPEHRARLREGKWHNSVTDFASRDPREAEADEFAAEGLRRMVWQPQTLRPWRAGSESEGFLPGA